MTYYKGITIGLGVVLGLWLLVKDVRVERLREITASDAMGEGFTDWNDFVTLWDSTIKPEHRDVYGWAADPWVWVIEFERCDRPEWWPEQEVDND